MYDRSHTIGASDVPIILGLSTFQTPMGLWMQKLDPGDREESPAMEAGNALEAGIREWTGRRIGASVVLPGPTLDEIPIVASFAEWATARPDAFFTVGDRVFCGEVKKRRFSDGWGEQGVDLIPDDVRCQTVWQNIVTDLPGCHVGAYILAADELRTYFTPRDAELEAHLRDQMGEWWHKHLDPHGPQHAPDLDASPATQEYLRKKWPQQTSPIREATAEEVALALEWHKLRAESAALETQADMLKARLQAAIGDAEGLNTPHGKVTWKFQAGANRWDTKALEAAHPELALSFKKQGEALRVLRTTIKLPA